MTERLRFSVGLKFFLNSRRDYSKTNSIRMHFC